MDQEMETPRKRKKADDPSKLEFEVGKVFTPGEAKEEDLQMDLDSGRYRAQKGQSGDRRQT